MLPPCSSFPLTFSFSLCSFTRVPLFCCFCCRVVHGCSPSRPRLLCSSCRRSLALLASSVGSPFFFVLFLPRFATQVRERRPRTKEAGTDTWTKGPDHRVHQRVDYRLIVVFPKRKRERGSQDRRHPRQNQRQTSQRPRTTSTRPTMNR